MSAEREARALVRAGRLVALALVAVAVVRGCVHGESWRADLLWSSVFGGSAVMLLALVGRLLDRTFVRGGLRTEIARGNGAAAITAAAHQVAVGILVSHCLYGDDLATLHVALVFFALGTMSLLVFQVAHRRLTRYQDDQEILGENAAVALGSAGLTLALAIIVGHAADGEFMGWVESLRAYAFALLLCVALYPVRQLVVKLLLLRLGLGTRGHALDQALAQDRNATVGAIEGIAYVAVALLVTGIW